MELDALLTDTCTYDASTYLLALVVPLLCALHSMAFAHAISVGVCVTVTDSSRTQLVNSSHAVAMIITSAELLRPLCLAW